MTEWRDIAGYEGCYQVSNDGQVRSLPRTVPMPRGGVSRVGGIVLKPSIDRYGYRIVGLAAPRRTRTVHRLVALAFLSDSHFDGAEVCHGDGNPLNNHVSNLRWDTRGANHLDSVMHGTNPNTQKTHCPQGHEYTLENTIRKRNQNGRMGRSCRQCKRARDRARLARYRVEHPRQPAKTHCPQGHAYAGDNLFVNNKGSRECRTCMRDRNRQRRKVGAA